MQLAQFNIARLRYDPDDPRVAPFMKALDAVNAAAERMPGFVWRYADDSGNATSTQVSTNPRVIVNMSVWADAKSLEEFVWKTVHERFYRKRGDWFEPYGKPHLVMWWVEDGHRPSVNEGLMRLATLQAGGPGEKAFGWEELPGASLWRESRCA